jgi:hypothetical protein
MALHDIVTSGDVSTDQSAHSVDKIPKASSSEMIDTESAGTENAQTHGSTKYDQQDMRRMGKRQELMVSSQRA